MWSANSHELTLSQCHSLLLSTNSEYIYPLHLEKNKCNNRKEKVPQHHNLLCSKKEVCVHNMDAPQWTQQQEMMLMKPPSLSMEEMMVSSSSTRPPQQLVEIRRTRQQKEQAFSCPRCNSTNTKFCYYNNYSLTQPRYFCKTCRRYWTEGGSLRNVPVGGGSRKNKRSSSSSSNSNSNTSSVTNTTSSFQSSISSPNSKKLAIQQNPKFHQGAAGHDLNLKAFPRQPNLVGEYGDRRHQFQNMSMGINNPSSTTAGLMGPVNANAALSAMELLRSSGVSSRGILNPFVPLPMVQESSAVYPNPSGGGFGLQDLRSTTPLNFPVDGAGGGGGGYDQNNVQDGAGGSGGDSRLLFPFENLRQVSSTNPSEHHQFEQNSKGQGGDSSGLWNGAMGGGTAW